ncbi:MAG TPA: hypothetical protein VF092_23545 [Longimicrobium sp.]
MAATLTLHLGSGYQNYQNPNVLNRAGSQTAKPGNQVLPNGPNYAWGNVGNTGSDAAPQATISFYFCTPGGAVDKWKYFLNNLIGIVPVNVPANDTTGQPVTCPDVWAPNSTAHTCMIAVVQAPNDPLPPGFMDPETTPQIGDRRVGQQNLLMASMAAGTTQAVAFRAPETAGSTLRVTQGGTDGGAMPAMASADAGEGAAAVEFGLLPGLRRDAGDVARPLARAEAAGTVRSLTVGEGEEGFRELWLHVPEDARPGSTAFLRIEAVQADRVVGGLAVLVRVE